MNHNGSGVAIDSNRLSVLNSFSAVANSQYSRNAVLAGNDGSVGEDTSHVGDKTHCVCKELCPRGRRQRANQYRSRHHLVELVCADDDARFCGDLPRTHWKSAHRIARIVVFDLCFFESDAFDLARFGREGTGWMMLFAGFSKLPAFCSKAC